jgi:hypothetical protein
MGVAPTPAESQSAVLLLHHGHHWEIGVMGKWVNGSQIFSVKPNTPITPFPHSAIGALAGIRTPNLPVRNGTCISLTLREQIEKLAAGTESHRALPLFRRALSCVSYSAVWKLVLPRGNAPRSVGYQPTALLLSYRRNWRRSQVMLPPPDESGPRFRDECRQLVSA